MTSRLLFREYEPRQVGSDFRENAIATAAQLRTDLQPRIPQLSVSGSTLTFQNLIGSVKLPTGQVVEVLPKVPSGDDWTTAVIHLLEPTTRIAVSGSRRSDGSRRKDNLTAALALEYARRLERAIRGEGPLQAYQRIQSRGRRLNGQLDVGAWIRTAAIDPTLLPVRRDVMTTDNDFTRGLSIVAGMLGRSVTGGQLGSRLRGLQRTVIPGHAIPSYVNPSVVRRRPSVQWQKYLPAWDIAVALLRHRSVIGDPGHANGLEVAVEPWPLLETVLERALRAITAQVDNPLRMVPKRRYPLLTRGSRPVSWVEPDGMLIDGSGGVVATFEAKYTVSRDVPFREHSHQALSTAAALSSPASVIVYPGTEPIRRFDVVGFNGEPVRLVSVGLEMFTYRRGPGDDARATRLLDALR